MSGTASQSNGNAWGDEISEERKAELEQRLSAWEQEADHGERKGPFDLSELSDEEQMAHKLTGADVFWLAARTLAATSEAAAVAAAAERLLQMYDRLELLASLDLTDLNLSGAALHEANLSGARLLRANLADASLDQANLTDAFLYGATLLRAAMGDVDLSNAFLYRANLAKAALVDANLSDASLEFANLTGAGLDRANLSRAELGSADLLGAVLSDAILSEATLAGANLSGAELDGADLSGARLLGVNLSGASMVRVRMNVETDLTDVKLSPATRVADVIWNDVPLARVAWETLPVVGDETLARQPRYANGNAKDAVTRLREYQAAVRAYRLLAVALRSQGLNEHADRFAYRAQLCQQTVFRRQGIEKLPAYIGSLLLWALSGYGYRLWRILAAYCTVVAVFALAYFLLGLVSSPHVTWYEALLASFTDIHGRVGVNTIFPLLSMQQWLAALESVIGIVIEGVFVAMLVQRFFGSK